MITLTTLADISRLQHNLITGNLAIWQSGNLAIWQSGNRAIGTCNADSPHSQSVVVKLSV